MSTVEKINQNLSERIISAIRSVVGEGQVPLHQPVFNGNELKYLNECIETTYVSSVGKFVDTFEDNLASYTGAKHVVAVVNGTSALHIALKLSGVLRDEEVLIPALNFVASANAVSYCGAIPHFIDSEENTLGVDPIKLKDYLNAITEKKSGYSFNKKTGRLIRAIVPMHTFGHPVDMDSLLSVCHDFNIIVIEDAAESIGSFYKGKHTGTFGLLGILSFNGNKTITTGGGGAILTNNIDIAKHAKHLTTTAKVSHAWEFDHDEIGYNYRLPNINAAIGCAQLEELPRMLNSKKTLYLRYREAFNSISEIKIMSEPKNSSSNYWLQTFLLKESNDQLLNSILEFSNREGIMIRPAWKLLSELSIFKGCPCMDLSQSISLSSRILNIPSSSNLK